MRSTNLLHYSTVNLGKRCTHCWEHQPRAHEVFFLLICSWKLCNIQVFHPHLSRYISHSTILLSYVHIHIYPWYLDDDGWYACLSPFLYLIFSERTSIAKWMYKYIFFYKKKKFSTNSLNSTWLVCYCKSQSVLFFLVCATTSSSPLLTQLT